MKSIHRSSTSFGGGFILPHLVTAFGPRLSLLMLEPEGAKASGNQAPPATLAEARAALATAQTSIATLTAERDTAVAESTRLQGMFDSATQAATAAQGERDQARADLATANATIATVTGERDTARGQVTSANTNIGRLEQLCQIRGVDPKSAVAVIPDASATGSVDDQIVALQEKAKAATPEERHKINGQIRALRDKQN